MLSEEGTSYSPYEVYVQKCKEVNLLPLSTRFDLNDLLFLHKVIYKLKPVDLPYYMTFFDGQSRLRSCHLDRLSLVSSIRPKSNYLATRSSNPLANTFFYRTHSKWNNLPLLLREIECPLRFKTSLKEHFWKNLIDDHGIFVE